MDRRIVKVKQVQSDLRLSIRFGLLSLTPTHKQTEIKREKRECDWYSLKTSLVKSYFLRTANVDYIHLSYI